MGSVIIKSKCGQKIKITKVFFPDKRVRADADLKTIENGEEYEASFYSYKKPSYIKVQTEE